MVNDIQMMIAASTKKKECKEKEENKKITENQNKKYFMKFKNKEVEVFYSFQIKLQRY